MTHALLKSLVLPPVSLFLLILLGLLWWRRPAGRGLILLAALALLALSLPIVSNWLIQPLEPFPALSGIELRTPEAQAIVVLAGGRHTGAPEYAGDTVNATSLLRARYAAWLQRRLQLPLIVSGGSPGGEEPAEGELMSRVLEQEFQVPVAAVEDRSRNTRENAAFSAALLRGMDIDRVYLVSSAWHLPRAVSAFERNGLQVIPAPTAFEGRDSSDGLQPDDFYPGPGALRLSYLAIHEYLGRGWYALLALIRS